MTEKPLFSQSPTQCYEADLRAGKISQDSAQREAINELQEVYDDLLGRWDVQPGFWQRLKQNITNQAVKRASLPVRGLYFWGGVGRGKTYLMDLFFQCLPNERKMRMHFHRFMQMVHRRLYEQKGKLNPLVLVAQSIAEEVDIICFDEFYVADIGDAMILANLLETLFDNGVTLIATSNIPPQGLYENGLQRSRFLPAIALLEHYTKVVNVDGGFDYRLRRLEQAKIFHFPLNAESDAAMIESFKSLSAGQAIEENRNLEILGRDICAKEWSEGLVWFDFTEVCGGPRSAADYIEIAQLFHTVMLSDIPLLTSSTDDLARRFISLVDEFYDHNIKLVVSAAEPLDRLYQGSELAFAFERTQSRLLEMQSHDYLAREHMP